ncbi:MAG: nicotinate (nicotinamide) nucleotide adenylyltransferase [Oscillospiraceae bacterium]
MVIALYGGSFNPPHLGHVDAAKVSLETLHPDKLVFVPASVPPHKALAQHSPSAQERLEMTRLAAMDVPGAEVSDYEINLGDTPSYTAMTAEHFRKKYPGARLMLLIGTDMLLTFEGWYEFEHILQLVELGVFPRDRGELEEIERFAGYMRQKYGAKITVIPKLPMPIASSEVRSLLPKRLGRDLLPEGVYARIIQKRHYGAQPQLEWLREQAQSLLKPSRVPHVLGCEGEAVRLSKRWGEAVGDAAEAGILHDITKKLEQPEQLLLCEKYGIMIDTVEKENAKLLHAKTGAMLAQERFGVTARVRDAIYWHTTGKPDMTLLEKIIYMADYIEPNRDFEGVDRLRELAYKDLDEAMILGLEMSIEDIRARGIEPHPKSMEALEWFLKRRER